MEGFGELAPNGEKFVISRPDTPQPWFNLLTNGSYSLLLSQSGQAKQFVGRASEPVVSYRYFYIRDLDSGQFWSLTWYPVKGRYDSYQCCHGVGKSHYQMTHSQIEASSDVFVPEDFDGEIWRFKIQNRADKKRRLATYFVADLPEVVNTAHQERGVLIGRARQDPTLTYFCATDRTANSFDCNRETFFGPYGNVGAPQTVVEGRGNRSVASGERAIMATQHNLTLGKNATLEFNFFVGATSKIASTRQALATLKRPGAIEKALSKSQEIWFERSKKVSVRTPTPSTDLLFNNFLKYQALNTPCQSTLSILKRLILDLRLGQNIRNQMNAVLSAQTKDGCLEDISTTILLVGLLIDFARETGDFDYFHRRVIYHDGGEGTVLHHFIRALSFCQAQQGSGGLISVPTLGDERIFSTAITGQVAHTWREAIPLLEHFGEHQLVDRYTHLLRLLTDTVDRKLKQGRYYSFGIHSKLGRLGAKGKPRQIDAESQAWLVISGLINQKQAETTLATVKKKLETKFGTVNFSPFYPTPVVDSWPESVDAPGSGQNSVITSATLAHLIWATTALGRGDDAYMIFEQINPLIRSKQLAVYTAEPYIIPRSIFGPSHQRYGQGEGGWEESGAGAVWLVVLEHIFGIQPVLGGLKIDPCLPKDWRQVEITRQFRGADYHIRIQNPFRVSKGIDRIIVDGVRLTGNVIRPFARGSHFVEVTLG